MSEHPMAQRVSLITLGARNVGRLAEFYDAMGWNRVDTADNIIVYDLIGQTLGLYDLDRLAEDLGLPAERLGRGASTLGYNAADRAGVDDLMARAKAAGAEILKTPQEVFWGGYHGYFADPEGHIWEVAHNPFSPLGPKGEFRWTGYA